LSLRLSGLSYIPSEKRAFSHLELKAWKRVMEKKILLSEGVLLVNGEPIKNLNTWTAPSGVFQWALISKTKCVG
jgi:hypothetical protein